MPNCPRCKGASVVKNGTLYKIQAIHSFIGSAQCGPILHTEQEAQNAIARYSREYKIVYMVKLQRFQCKSCGHTWTRRHGDTTRITDKDQRIWDTLQANGDRVQPTVRALNQSGMPTLRAETVRRVRAKVKRILEDMNSERDTID